MALSPSLVARDVCLGSQRLTGAVLDRRQITSAFPQGVAFQGAGSSGEPTTPYGCVCLRDACSRRPLLAQRLRLLQHQLDSLCPEVGWVTVFIEDAADHDAGFGSGAFSQRPVDAEALGDVGDQFGGDDLWFIDSHGQCGASVNSRGDMEADFAVAQPLGTIWTVRYRNLLYACSAGHDPSVPSGILRVRYRLDAYRQAEPFQDFCQFCAADLISPVWLDA